MQTIKNQRACLKKIESANEAKGKPNPKKNNAKHKNAKRMLSEN